MRSQICCAIYVLWARRILQEIENPFENATATLREMFDADSPELRELDSQIRPDDLHHPDGSGYVVDALFSAKWACGNDDYEKTVKAAISLGNDTDTTACIAGGIAGLKAGVNQIPARWRENLLGREIYEPLLEKLVSTAND